MGPESIAIAVSLVALAGLLAVLSARGVVVAVRRQRPSQLLWGSGLALATLAVAIEAVVYVGVVTPLLLQTYVFCSAAIVGVLSLGTTSVLGGRRRERAYAAYTVTACALVGAASFATPLSARMVVGGIIAGNPPVDLLVLSSLVTVPATVVLLAASVRSLRRSRRWPTVLLVAGAAILGAGGTLYIAAFPVALYYAEFVGILLLFLGVLGLPTAAPVRASAASGADP